MNPASRCGDVLRLADSFTLLTSPQLRTEVLAVLYRPELRTKLTRLSTPRDFELVITLLDAAELIEPQTTPSVCRDPNDDKVFACAKAGSADYIVSEDNDILSVAAYEGAQVVTPDTFLAVLADSA